MNGRCPEENRHGSFLLLLLEWCNLGDKDDSALSLHHEFNPSSTKIGHVRAKTLLDYIKSINNPFDAGIRLQNISTGADIPQEVVDGLLECLEIGEKSYEEFVKTRFQNKEKHLHDTIPTNRKTVFVKRISTPSTAKKSMAKKDAAETIRYINYARERGYSMLELLKYELTSTSQFLTTECKDGIKLKKPDKASLARELVSHLPQETRNVKSDAQMTIVDFMALVRKLPMKKMGLHTFEELAKSLSDRILATGSVSTRIDIIFYVYQKSSIKQMERAQRSSSEEITITIRSDNQKLPVNLDMFWSSMLNKVRLQEKLLAGNETQIAELSSNQEEADDRIMFHINDGVVKHGVQSVLVDSPDTDVFVNLIFHFNTTWQLQKLYMKLGNRKTKKTVPVHLLVDQLDNGLVSCLPAIHALSGCDSTKLSPQITSNAEKFLVSGLKKTDCSTFDEYRWEQYHNSKKELDFNQLVCCSSTIREHIKRAYLQCKMWLQAPTPVVTKPDPLQYGMKRVRSSVHDNEEAIPSKRSALDTSHSSTTQHVEETNVGILESVSVRNFMCHNRLSFKLSPNINFIIGRNGSGKSAVLAAVIVGLGGKAMLTNRGSSIKNFIKNGKSFTEISVKLKNQGPDAYKVEQYGNFIIVERRIFLDGSSQYKIRSESGQVISNKKEELTHILDQFNIQVDNPVSILNQETSKNFLNTKSAHEKYKFFLRATQLEQMKSDYALAEEQKKIARNLLDEKENMLPELKKEVEDWERCWRFHETLGDLRSKVDSLKQELVWAHVIEKERSLEKEYKVLSGTKSRLPKFELKVKEHKVKVDNSEKQLSENQSKLTETSNEVNEIQPKHNVAKSKLKLQKDQVSSKKYVDSVETLCTMFRKGTTTIPLLRPLSCCPVNGLEGILIYGGKATIPLEVA
ncbi:Structural maintenance of chromosomes protein 6 [Nymphon striatum]|nr:Structural maintenance of chromosomes protein 6 [Nymphon striatum]